MVVDASISALAQAPEGLLRFERADWEQANRLARAGALERVSAGLYWRGRASRFGPSLVPLELALAALYTGRGLGPSGWSAASLLGLTTQVPARAQYCLVGRTTSFRGVVLSGRANQARRGLSELELAVLEMLRDWRRYSDRGWPALVDVVHQNRARLRLALLLEAAELEPRARSAAARLEADLMWESLVDDWTSGAARPASSLEQLRLAWALQHRHGRREGTRRLLALSSDWRQALRLARSVADARGEGVPFSPFWEDDFEALLAGSPELDRARR